jgi:alpha-D-ribose 1-methylphosphonate 5-phosphate C-P lyase
MVMGQLARGIPMIELSEDQVLILQNDDNEPHDVVNPRTREHYVLVRREVYERLRGLRNEDFTAEDAFRAQIESAATAGWDDPALDIYNDIETQMP